MHDLTASDANGPLQPKFAGFNLLVLSPSRTEPKAHSGQQKEEKVSFTYNNAALVTNSGGGGAISCRLLAEHERRTGGLSNGVDGHGACDWPKVQEGQAELEELLNKLEAKENGIDEAELVDELFKIMLYVSFPALSKLEVFDVPGMQITVSL